VDPLQRGHVDEAGAVPRKQKAGRVQAFRQREETAFGDRLRAPCDALAVFEPGSDVVARITVLAEGTQGHLTGAAIERFGLEGENPQVWALGVKEVWRVANPLRRVIHTMGWPLRAGAN
jgi:flavin-dependent dehydrogenase